MPAYVEWRFRDGKKIGPGLAEALPSKVKESTSSNGLTKYLTILWSDGILSCDCPGWTILKKDSAGNRKPRTCKHCKAAEAANFADMARVDEFVPASNAPARRTQLDLSQRHARRIRIGHRTEG